MPSLPVIVSMLAAGLTSFSRVFDQTRPGWSRFPAWAQTLFPSLLMACGAIVAGLAHVVTATDLAVVIVGGVFLIFPGMPSNRSAAPMQAGKMVTGAPSAGDLAVASVVKANALDGVPLNSVRPPKMPTVPPVPPMVMLMLGALMAALGGCGLAAVAAPILARAAVIIADASNAVSAAEALLPLLHLDATEDVHAHEAIAKARQGIAAAAALDDGATDLTEAQLDASLADFRIAWADLKGALATKRLGSGTDAVAVALPVPLAVRRVQK